MQRVLKKEIQQVEMIHLVNLHKTDTKCLLRYAVDVYAKNIHTFRKCVRLQIFVKFPIRVYALIEKNQPLLNAEELIKPKMPTWFRSNSKHNQFSSFNFWFHLFLNCLMLYFLTISGKCISLFLLKICWSWMLLNKIEFRGRNVSWDSCCQISMLWYDVYYNSKAFTRYRMDLCMLWYGWLEKRTDRTVCWTMCFVSDSCIPLVY